MAINVNNVYQTVLLILNKEQRGYMTPDEFNKTATQVQLDVFQQYFDDLNQQLRVPQADYDYTDRQMAIDEKISTFKCIGSCGYSSGTFSLPTTDELTGIDITYNDDDDTKFSFYKLGVVTYEEPSKPIIELQRLQRFDFYNIQQSPLTKPTKSFPIYLYESGNIYVSPTTIQSNIKASFVRKPLNVVWGYGIGSLNQYIYAAGSSQDFELLPEEQVNVILRILQYSGIIIRDPQIIQAASSEVAQNEANKKS